MAKSLNLYLLILFTVADCSKIMIIIGVSSPSHYNVFVPVIEELANRKHDITVQSYFTLKESRPNVKEFKITPGETESNTTLLIEFFRQSLVIGPIAQTRNFVPLFKSACLEYFGDDTTKNLISAGMQYDLVVVDALMPACQVAVASLIAKHIILLYTTSWASHKVTAAPTPLSYVPNFMDLMPSKMDFFQRLENTRITVALRLINQHEIEVLQQEAISEQLPQAGTIEEIEKKVVFTLTNADSVITSPRPTMPNIVHCGGMHCRKGKPLPKDLNDFVESSGDDGFIVFGLGSNMKSEYLTSGERHAILSAFSRLKQKVIWKFEATLEDLPENVKIIKWLPQQDLLGHPKVRLFITHSGMLSLQEAVYHAVPVIGVPFFGDQRGNIIRMKEIGIGEHLDFMNLTADGFYELITKVLNDNSYYENMKKYSAIFKDQPDRPVDRAAFWIEYVIRHDGARHFRSAGEDLNFFQYFLLDVVGFILMVSFTTFAFVAYSVKFLISKLRAKKLSKNETAKKIN